MLLWRPMLGHVGGSYFLWSHSTKCIKLCTRCKVYQLYLLLLLNGQYCSRFWGPISAKHQILCPPVISAIIMSTEYPITKLYIVNSSCAMVCKVEGYYRLCYQRIPVPCMSTRMFGQVTLEKCCIVIVMYTTTKILWQSLTTTTILWPGLLGQAAK